MEYTQAYSECLRECRRQTCTQKVSFDIFNRHICAIPMVWAHGNEKKSSSNGCLWKISNDKQHPCNMRRYMRGVWKKLLPKDYTHTHTQTFTNTESVWLKYTLKRFVHNNWRSVVRTAKFIGNRRDERYWCDTMEKSTPCALWAPVCGLSLRDRRRSLSARHKRNTSRVCRRMCAVILFHTFAIGKFQYSY